MLVLSFPDWGATPFGAGSGRDLATIEIETDEFNAAAEVISTQQVQRSCRGDQHPAGRGLRRHHRHQPGRQPGNDRRRRPAPVGGSGRDLATIEIETDEFNAAAEVISTQQGVAFVDITDISRDQGGNPAMIAEDGLHPSARMYALWSARCRSPHACSVERTDTMDGKPRNGPPLPCTPLTAPQAARSPKRSARAWGSRRDYYYTRGKLGSV